MTAVPLWLEVVLRRSLVIVVLLFYTRLLGKKQISQLTYFEYVTGITIGNLAGYATLEDSMHLGHSDARRLPSGKQ